MPLQATSGAASYDGFGGGVAAVPQYIEDVFSTWLYTGNGSTQTITNGIDLADKGGLVWIKNRSNTAGHAFYDTTRPVETSFYNVAPFLSSNTTDPSYYPYPENNGLSAFGASGFSVSRNGTSSPAVSVNTNGNTYASWTFRKQPKFFDVVTWTGNSTARTISHSLGSAPGCIILKAISGSGDWWVYHRSLGATQRIQLNDTFAAAANVNPWNNTEPTSTVFSLSSGGAGNDSGITYVAYLFAHNAGGFGLSGTDNVISCGSFTADGSGNATVTLGYEPQWITQKLSSGTGNWETYDTMRGWSQTQIATLYPNLSSAEGGGAATLFYPTATGFQWVGGALTAGGTYIYIAIRRGPMKVPTTGTSVFSTNIETTSGTQTVTTNFPVDFNLNRQKNSASSWYAIDRLRGVSAASFPYLVTNTTAAEATGGSLAFDSNIGIIDSSWWTTNGATFWSFRRAPSFFDEVCYTGTGSARTVAHNLAAVPELMIVKKRNAAASWTVYSKSIPITHNLILNNGTASAASAVWNSTAPTSSVFSVSALGAVNATSDTYVTYLFATCDGVSKVGSYTGNGTTQTINCGFTGGARFVLLKRTDDVGDWYVYDTARGMTVLTDPYLWLNSTAAEVATLGSVTTVSTGFALDSAVTPDINTNGGTFIFLAIA